MNLLAEKKELNNDLLVKVRSTGKLLQAKININQESAEVDLKTPEDGISPGSSMCFL